MRIAILGATGFVGKVLLRHAIERGMEVKTLARSPEKLSEFASRITIIRGDYFNPEDLNRVCTGVDAVLSTVGPPPGRHKTLQPENYAKAISQLIDTMEKNDVSRFIHLASAGTPFRDEKLSMGRKVLGFILKFIAPLVIPSKTQELAVLDDSTLNWTSIRPPLIVSNTSGAIISSHTGPRGMTVDVDQLVNFMLDIIGDENFYKTAPFVGSA